MYRRSSMTRRIRRLFQSSVFIGIVMALVITPPVFNLYASDSDCEENCKTARDNAINAANQTKQIAYNACNATYDTAFHASLNQYNADHNTCIANWINAIDQIEDNYQAQMAACLLGAAVPPVAVACAAIATAAYSHVVADANKTSEACTEAASKAHANRVTAAERVREIC